MVQLSYVAVVDNDIYLATALQRSYTTPSACLAESKEVNCTFQQKRFPSSSLSQTVGPSFDQIRCSILTQTVGQSNRAKQSSEVLRRTAKTNLAIDQR